MGELTGPGLLDRLLAAIRGSEPITDLLRSGLDPAIVIEELAPIAESDASVTWVGEGRGRVDVVMTSDVDEWRVVLGSGDAGVVDRLSVYRRPDHTPGYEGGRAVVVNGPVGVGKTTVLRALRDLDRARPWVLFDEPESVGWVAPEFLIWRERSPALQRGFLAAIGALARAGNLVGVAAGGRPQADFAECFDGVPTVWVGLRGEPGVLEARERDRVDRWGSVAPSAADVHAGWTYDLTFDTSESPDPIEVADEILAAVRRHE